jgi:hypothetical protein
MTTLLKVIATALLLGGAALLLSTPGWIESSGMFAAAVVIAIGVILYEERSKDA